MFYTIYDFNCLSCTIDSHDQARSEAAGFFPDSCNLRLGLMKGNLNRVRGGPGSMGKGFIKRRVEQSLSRGELINSLVECFSFIISGLFVAVLHRTA